MDIRPGDIVFGKNGDPHQVIQLIGAGGFGLVYEISDQADNRFALKTISTALLNDFELEALINEGQLAMQVEHENVIRVLYFHDGKVHPNLPPYTISELAHDGTLQQLIDERRAQGKQFKIEEARAMLLQLSTGMRAINEKLVHRDIKPDNVLISAGVLKIADFGLSKIVGAATRTATFKDIQHIKYRAPEAWVLDKNTAAMDMYSMGLVFYEILTLGFPYSIPSSSDIDEWKKMHLGQMPIDPRTINEDIDLSLATLIQKMINKRPVERCSSWDEILERLQTSTAKAEQASPDIKRLVECALVNQRKAEETRLARDQQAGAEKEYQTLVEYAFDQLFDAAKTTVEAFNQMAQDIKMAANKSHGLSFMIYLEGKPKHYVSAIIKIIHDSHKLKNMSIKAWGHIKAPSGRGFNIILATDSPDDIYGDWYTFHVTHRKATMHQDDRPEPFPFELDELPREIQYLSAMHVYITKQGRFEKAMLNDLLEELLQFG